MLSLPDVPTVVEAGIPDGQTSVRLSIALPTGKPRPIVNKVDVDAADVTGTLECGGEAGGAGDRP